MIKDKPEYIKVDCLTESNKVAKHPDMVLHEQDRVACLLPLEEADGSDESDNQADKGRVGLLLAGSVLVLVTNDGRRALGDDSDGAGGGVSAVAGLMEDTAGLASRREGLLGRRRGCRRRRRSRRLLARARGGGSNRAGLRRRGRRGLRLGGRRRLVLGSARGGAGVTTRAVVGDNVGSLALGNSNDAEVGTTSTSSRVGAVDDASGLNLAGKAVAATVGALNLDTPVEVALAKTGFVEGRVHADLNKGLAAGIGVGASDNSSPVALGLAGRAPDAGLLSINTRRVQVEVGSGSLPVAGIRDSDGSGGINSSGNKHGLVARKDGLAPHHGLGALVDGLDSASSLNTVGLVGEGLLDGAVGFAVKTAVHGSRVRVGRARLPLRADHAGLTGIGAPVTGLALLIGAHGPTSILGSGGDSNHVVAVRELASAALDGSSAVDVLHGVAVLKRVQLTVSERSIDGGSSHNGKDRAGGGLKRLSLHGEGRRVAKL